jgi:hypothetical protein
MKGNCCLGLPWLDVIFNQVHSRQSKQAEFLSKPSFGGKRNQRSLEEGKCLFQ